MRGRPSPRRGYLERLSSRQWTTLILSGMATMLVLSALAGAYVLRTTTALTARLTDQISPALINVEQLQKALLDQETGLRGYLLSRDRSFLQPYTDGQTAQTAAVARLRALPLDKELDKEQAADLAVVQHAVERWRQDFTVPVLAWLARSGHGPVDPALIDLGKADFDQIRAAVATQQQHLAALRQTTLDEVRHADAWQNAIFLAILVTFLLTGLTLAGWLQLAILRPLSRLAAGTRRVADGDFEYQIEVRGPTDLAALGADVETMRQRIVSQLAAALAASARLGEQATELRRSNAELEQFAYVASHDLQEPLRKVASFCQLLGTRYGDQLDERGHQYLDFAVDGAKRMQVLINDLLTFSRVGQAAELREQVALADVLRQALTNLANTLEETGAQVTYDPLPAVRGDPTLLVMLMQNLVGNAVKFRAPDRPPQIRINVEQLPGQCRLAVTDNGIGVDPQFAEKIFVIFQRLHPRDAYQGTGIGLALCKKIVEYHGGRIELDTSYRAGARFVVTLPVETKQLAEKSPAADPAASSEERAHRVQSG